MSITVMVKQLAKPSRAITVEEGTTIEELLEDELQMDTNGKSFTVGATTQRADYVLQDGDTLTINVNNKGAVA